MAVYETEVPGVGRKFEVDLGGECRLVVLIHYDGKRDLYLRPEENADSEKLVSLSGQQARQVGSILEGAYFQPVDLEDIRVPLGEAILEWIVVPADSPLSGNTLQSGSVRERTGTSIIAIQRGEETISNPKPDFGIEPDDILVAIGTREELGNLSSLVQGDEDADES